MARAARRRGLMRAVAALLVLLAVAPGANAQAPADVRTQPELRADVIAIGNHVAVQAGGGVQIPFGYYARVGVIAAAGADIAHSGTDASGRLDLIARFLFDPFRQTRWGVSAGGGVSIRGRQGEGLRPYLAALIDLEGPRSKGGISPAFQLGVGGGIRAGAALRWGSAAAR